MTLNELKAAILENGTGIYFEFNGKKCGVEPEVQDSVFTFTMWYGELNHLQCSADFERSAEFFMP